MSKIKTIIFDLGGVLIDWNPRYLYRKIFNSEEKVEWFMQHITTMDWNEEQDAGRPVAEATALLVEKFPAYQSEIKAYYDRWTEMLGGPIAETVTLLEEIKASEKYDLYALTNWSGELFPEALRRYGFLQYFKGILVSGKEKLKKPDPRIYHLILNRYHIDPATAIFIDDSARNVVGAEAIGLPSIHFQSPEQLRMILTRLGVLNNKRNKMMRPKYKDFMTQTLPKMLNTLHGDQEPNFGLMTAQHMVEHLIYVVKVSMKRKGEPIGEPSKSQLYFRKFIENGAIFQHRPKKDITKADLPELRMANITDAIATLEAAITKFYILFEENPNFKSYNEMMGEFNMEELELFNYQHCRWHAHQFGLKLEHV